MLRYSLLLVFLGIFTVAQGQISEVEYQLNPLSTTESTSLLQIEQTSASHIALKGSLRQLIAFLKGVNTSQISVSDKDNASYELSYRQETDKSKLLEKLSQELHLNILESQRGGLTLQLTLKSYDKLSGASAQAKNFPYSKIHMDDEQASLDGFSLKDMLSVLSQLREIPILLHNKPNMYEHTPMTGNFLITSINPCLRHWHSTVSRQKLSEITTPYSQLFACDSRCYKIASCPSILEVITSRDSIDIQGFSSYIEVRQ